MQRLPIPLKLAIVAVSFQIFPNIFDCHACRAFQQAVGQLRASVREARPLPFRGIEQHLVSGYPHLCKGRQTGPYNTGDQKAQNCSFHQYSSLLLEVVPFSGTAILYLPLPHCMERGRLTAVRSIRRATRARFGAMSREKTEASISPYSFLAYTAKPGPHFTTW